MSTSQSQTVVWIPHPTLVWTEATLISHDTTSKILKYLDPIDSSSEKQIKVETIHLKNPEILIGQNDLTSLSYLHEPAVLHNLNYRFNLNTIYTYCGIVLVAINPYEELDIYNRESILAYRQGGSGGELDPHIFAVAESAYNKMEREGKNQSIIVSGESGAGKTVSAKYAMRYFATVGGSENETQIEQKVLASSPIMEAIGNAKTTRNDNSSRFGKYIELHFNKKYSITGASMRTYLLEKSRVVYQSTGERNYHIFYQLCKARSSHSELSELFLEDQTAFHYLNQGKSTPEEDALLKDDFEETVNALILLGFGLDERRMFFKVVAGILQLGNLEFIEKGAEECYVAKDSPALQKLTQLLNIPPDQLRLSLTTRLIKSQTESITKKLTKKEALYSRDALAKLIYSELFNWIVKKINGELQRYCDEKNIFKFIGVLDIYGFETFEINSFEQFCINYANEKLQQQFNQHVFKLEQQEYIREGISWTMIDFYDNQPCIDLIESKLGILDLLNEEARLPNGSDASWILKLHSKHASNKHYAKAKFCEADFVIKHFADSVTYSSKNFIEKNRDTVLLDVVKVVTANNKFLAEILSLHLTPDAKTNKQTLGSSFRASLSLLMGSLNETTPHYVRCIKPNDKKLPFVFDFQRGVQQLRACGVLETIRISAAGFPSRWTYAEFYSRYRMLDTVDKKNNKNKDAGKLSEALIIKLISDGDNYRLGKTKIFFRAGQVAYLEKIRLEKLQRSGLIIQRVIAGRAKRCAFLKMKKSAELLQRFGRGLLARRVAHHLRCTRAAIKIQAYTRRFIALRAYKLKKQITLKIQTITRGILARRQAAFLRSTLAATKIQKYFRGIIARRLAASHRAKIILAQSCIRRYLAKKQLRSKKIESRSLEHVKQLNKGLENKIISLQQKIESINKENNNFSKIKLELEKSKGEIQLLKNSEKEFKNLRIKFDDLEKREKLLTEEKTKEKEINCDLINEKSRLEGVLKEKEGDFDKLKKEIEELKETVQNLEEKLFHFEATKKEKEELEKELEKVKELYQNNIAKMHSGLIEHQRPIPLPRSNQQPQQSPQAASQRESLKMQNLEQENAKLRKDLERILESSSAGGESDEILRQLQSLNVEKKRLEDEKMELTLLLGSGSNDVLVEGGRIVITTLEKQLQEEKEMSSKLRRKYEKLLNSLDNPSLKEKFNTSDESMEINILKKKNRIYLGMLEYKQEDLGKILRAVVIDLPPSVALTSSPSLPAYILFMMIRYTDYVNDDDRVRTLLTKAVTNIKKQIRKKGHDSKDVLILWLTNILRLLHTLKQYSGDASFQAENSQRQNEQALKNFDLFEYRQVLSDHAVWVYMLLIKSLEDSIQSLIVPGILENSMNNDPSPSLTSSTPSNKDQKPLETLINSLEQTFNILTSFNMDALVIQQIFKQLFYYLCAGALNNLLLRRELCHWSKGMDIRYNISVIEDWSRGKKMDEGILKVTLAPVIQASQILQARKSDKDCDSICDICDQLSVQQVIKLLNLYSSKDGLDTDKVSKNLISAVQSKLTEMRSAAAAAATATASTEKQSLLMDTKFTFAVNFPFNPSSVKLEEISIPENFGIGSWVKML